MTPPSVNTWLCNCVVDGLGQFHFRPEECVVVLRADRERLRADLARMLAPTAVAGMLRAHGIKVPIGAEHLIAFLAEQVKHLDPSKIPGGPGTKLAPSFGVVVEEEWMSELAGEPPAVDEEKKPPSEDKETDV